MAVQITADLPCRLMHLGCMQGHTVSAPEHLELSRDTEPSQDETPYLTPVSQDQPTKAAILSGYSLPEEIATQRNSLPRSLASGGAAMVQKAEEVLPRPPLQLALSHSLDYALGMSHFLASDLLLTTCCCTLSISACPQPFPRSWAECAPTPAYDLTSPRAVSHSKHLFGCSCGVEHHGPAS